jgi:aspartate oxidase
MTKRVLIAGAGVAAVEAVLALRHVDFPIDLVASTHALEHRAASVAAPGRLAGTARPRRPGRLEG